MTTPKAAPKRKPTKTTTSRPRKKAVIAPAITKTDVEIIERDIESREPKPVSPQEKQAKAEAYYTLKQAGVEPPAELAAEVEAWIAETQVQQAAQSEQQAVIEQQRQADLANANVNGPWYVRNCYNAQFNIRLDRQTEKRRIQLKARGEPGDLHPLKDEDLQDPILRQNVGLGLCEIIPAGEAQEVIAKQTTNMRHRVHAPLAVLRNEYDEAYKAGAVRVEAEFNSQGVTVATVDPRALQGQMTDRELGGTRSTGGIQRTQAGPSPAEQANMVSGFVPTGGNPAVISHGGMSPDAQARAQQEISSRKTREANMHRGPGEITVTVEPVKRN